MKKLTFFCILVFLFGLALCGYVTPTGCTPFGVRLALGRNYYDSKDS